MVVTAAIGEALVFFVFKKKKQNNIATTRQVAGSASDRAALTSRKQTKGIAQRMRGRLERLPPRIERCRGSAGRFLRSCVLETDVPQVV